MIEWGKNTERVCIGNGHTWNVDEMPRSQHMCPACGSELVTIGEMWKILRDVIAQGLYELDSDENDAPWNEAGNRIKDHYRGLAMERLDDASTDIMEIINDIRVRNGDARAT